MGTKELGVDGSTEGSIDDIDEIDRGGHHRAAWELAAETRAASRARALTGRTLRAWRVSDPADIDDIVLMVDELVTNAVVHGTGPVRLTLRLDGRRIAGEVSDGNPMAPPAPGPPPHILDWAEAGRGLLLVAALATEFGARPDGAGKTVWFTRLLDPLDSRPLTVDTPGR
ncbi:ATP-binding protein [Actinomadura macra]|uniref:ATP-binding protein n=1 Tax=Actinomadura macra TaxID=46164 RepID=UPI000829B88A|nr:ATP-binding protein [Actinomadura macra]